MSSRLLMRAPRHPITLARAPRPLAQADTPPRRALGSAASGGGVKVRVSESGGDGLRGLRQGQPQRGGTLRQRALAGTRRAAWYATLGLPTAGAAYWCANEYEDGPTKYTRPARAEFWSADNVANHAEWDAQLRAQLDNPFERHRFPYYDEVQRRCEGDERGLRAAAAASPADAEAGQRALAELAALAAEAAARAAAAEYAGVERRLAASRRRRAVGWAHEAEAVRFEKDARALAVGLGGGDDARALALHAAAAAELQRLRRALAP